MELRQRLNKLKQRQKGFTLVELIVVIAIIGVLAGVMLPRYFSFTDDARTGAAISEAKSIRTLAETYYANNGVWPKVIGTTPFTIQTGVDGDGDPTDDNSPSFTGTINVADGTVIPNGAFIYTKDLQSATCTAEGIVTGN